MKSSKPKKVAFFGDSLTQGIPGINYVKLVEKKFGKEKGIKVSNMGKGGDTIHSLTLRLEKYFNKNASDHFDLSFILIGVNDIFGEMHPKLCELLKQEMTQEEEKVKNIFSRLLKLVESHSDNVVVLSPFLLTEDPLSSWNEKVGNLSKMLEAVVEEYPNIPFVNIRDSILESLKEKEKKEKHYIPESLFGITLDVYFGTSRKAITKKSKKRGLFYTLDGVHLNCEGADHVSGICSKKIEEILIGQK